MSDPLSSDRLSAADEALIEEVESKWRCGQQPDLEEVLNRAAPQASAHVLAELIHLDLEYRICRDESVRVEDYLQRFPQLAADTQVVLELIETEYTTLQRRMGPSLEGYLRRFPHLRLDLLSAFGEGASPKLLDWQSRLGNQAVTQLGQGLGPYQLLQEVGQGAFGTVYKAVDTRLGRVVALKVPNQGYADRPQLVTSLLHEARHAAQLEHPRIVAIYEVEVQPPSTISIACQFIDGRNLSQVIAEGAVDARVAAGWIADLADAVEYAHERGMIHRDIKPGNILVDLRRQVWLTDFGLAHALHETGRASNPETVAGTLAYMSPEQAGVVEQPVDTRTDIYSLGVVLYELLTGRLPFSGNRQSLLKQLSECDPPGLRTLSKGLAKDLEQICLKAIRRDPADRYQTANDFALDLRRYLNGLPVSARPIAKWRTMALWCQRKPALAGLIGALSLSIMIGIGGISWNWRQALVERHRAEEAFRVVFDALENVVQLSGNVALRDPTTQQAMNEIAATARNSYVEVLSIEGTPWEDELKRTRAAIGLGSIALQEKKYEQALEQYRQAEISIQLIKSQHPATPTLAKLESEVALAVATVHRRSGASQAALAQYRNILEQLDLTPQSLVLKLRIRAEVSWYIAELEKSLGRPAAALPMCEQAGKLWQEIARLDPLTAREVEIGLAKETFLRAAILRDMDQVHESQKLFELAADRFLRLTEWMPTALNFRRDLAASYHSLASLHCERHEFAEAATLLNKAIALRKELVNANQRDSGYRSDLEGSMKNMREIQAHIN